MIIGVFYSPISTHSLYIFPYLLAITCINFLASFVPIFGIFISGIPILFAGIVEYPGWSIVVAIIAMLFVVHAFEGYYLNPRIV
jgi:predicted PurR-regulated permease PerM